MQTGPLTLSPKGFWGFWGFQLSKGIQIPAVVESNYQTFEGWFREIG